MTAPTTSRPQQPGGTAGAAPPAGPGGAPGTRARRARLRDSLSPLRVRVLDRPGGTYLLMLGSTLLLLVLGLVMVWSSSSILSLRANGSAYTIAARQGLFAVVGLVLLAGASRVPVGWWRRLAWPGMVASVLLLLAVLVPGVGTGVHGQRNWIKLFGPFQVQPSEFAKLALALWTADVLTRKAAMLDRWNHLLVPVVPVTALVMGLVLLEGDFGNALIIGLVVAAVLFVVGAPLRLFGALALVGALGVTVLSVLAPYRLGRFASWLDPSADPQGYGWQVTQGSYAFGTGGWFGVGLGASREKWGDLPEAHTDFIFPVVGEELGLLGTLATLVLFAVLTGCLFRLVRRSSDRFVQLVAAGVAGWILVQAFVNIGAVLQLLPITGVPLPLVSYGGSSLVPTLVAVGMLASFARPRAGLLPAPGR